MSYAEQPGLMTDMLLPFGGTGLTYPDLVKAGFTWSSYQCYNSELFSGTKDFDLKAVRDHGFKNVGVWGVIYSVNDFYNGAKKTAAQALDSGAQHIIINAEECFKHTDAKREGLEIIRGCRDAGWTQAVDLMTLGPPWSPQVNDYHMDLKSFLDTGGSIMPEDYYNESEGYKPVLSTQYLDRLRVPRKQQNHTIALYPGAKGRIDGAGWVPLLKEAGIHKNFNVYMIQHLEKPDVTALSNYIKTPTAPLPPINSSVETRAMMESIADRWLEANPGDEPKARIRAAKRIVSAGNTNEKWARIDDQIKVLLDSVGIPN